MKKNININRLISILLIFPFLAVNLGISTSYASTDKIVYPLKEVSKLSCRYQDFKDLSSSCKQSLPILKSKDYSKYVKQNGWYNDYTRFYTVLWWSSYKYGWDVWFWGHEGTDIATAKWTPVYSIADWKVIEAKMLLGWGNTVTIEHYIRGKKVFSNYSHLSKILVKKGQKVKAWTKIWEVWTTGNSTWNHLHLQIDLDTPFHPFYYDRKTCPYSYSDITEKWVCFDELSDNTIDPLVFLETNWKILDEIQVVNKVDRSSFNKVSNSNNSDEDNFLDIFNRTVYIGYSKDDIKKVQKVFKTLWYYKGIIDWDYKKLEPNVIEYQIKRKIISSKNDLWAGRFWPKTRAQAKQDYLKIVWNIGQKKTVFKKEVVTRKSKIQKISRNNILTRAEIEKREIDDFLRNYNIDLKLSNFGWNVNLGSTFKLYIDIKSKRTSRPFRWNTPLNITFPVNNDNIKVFPTKLYNFSDGHRDVKITWLKEWNSVLQVKLWNRILKSFNIKVLKAWKTIYPSSARILWSSKIVLWDVKKWIIVMRDKDNKNLVNIRYGSSFKLKANDDALICLKSWSLKNLRNIFKSNCKPSDFKKEINFDYNKTIAWLVLIEYKAIWTNPKIELLNNYKNLNLSTKKLYVYNPKDLKENYVYKDDVLKMLKENIVWGINKWYFLQNRDLVWQDAINWIMNALEKLKQNSIDSQTKKLIDQKISLLKKERISRYKPINREDFLNLSYKYLVLDNSKWYVFKKYRDLDSNLNKKVWLVFWQNTWKDEFWENYFRPNIHITRWEAAYMLSKVYDKNLNYFLTLR